MLEMTDEELRKLGWRAVARDDRGRVVSLTCRDDEEDFRSWLAEQYDAGRTITGLE